MGEARVQGGEVRRMPLVAPLAYSVTYPVGGSPPPVKLTLRYEGPLRAPLVKGTEVATLRISTPGEPPRDLPLLAGSSTGVAGPLERLRNGLFELVGL